ncbi:ImmA/IrrE family metallo-endopeptidase [Galliscardovia ingluviei]|uniref:ImmA/IrrE family metallo-endopeptidase n=1 Tax=Galliscardovia ingluviei TaxID=1769422 RepID=UPI0035309BEA
MLANEFAGSLLMPEQEVQKCIEAGMSRMDLAVYFGVSVDAITYRRKILNICTKAHPAFTIDGLSRTRHCLASSRNYSTVGNR